MQYLRQSTASQSVKLGPFLDSSDGNTEETGLTINNTDIKLSKNGGTLASKNSGGCTHDANGMYTATFDATDTNTVGPLTVYIHVTGALYVRQEFRVLEEAVYDALFASGAAAKVDLVDAPNATAVTAIQNGLATVSGVLTTQMTESYAADGVAPTLAQALFLIQQALTEFAYSGTTNTVKKLDGSTTAATFTLDDASDPTSQTRAT